MNRRTFFRTIIGALTALFIPSGTNKKRQNKCCEDEFPTRWNNIVCDSIISENATKLKILYPQNIRKNDVIRIVRTNEAIWVKEKMEDGFIRVKRGVGKTKRAEIINNDPVYLLGYMVKEL